jgi:hypothetical protein
MALKKTQQQSEGTGIDYNFLHSQVEDDTHEGRISVIIDAGMQKAKTTVYGIGMNKDNVNYFTSRDDAIDYVNDAVDLMGEWVAENEGYTDEPEEVPATEEIITKHNLKDVEVDDTLYRVDFNIVTPKDREEIIYAVDLVDTRVQYKEDDDKTLQFRVWLNQLDFMTREMKGFSTKFAPPKKKGAAWTFAPASMHTKLAEATGNKGVIDPSHADFGDLSLFLNKPVGVQTTQKESSSNGKDYINLKTSTPTRLPKKVLDLGVTELDCTPEAIGFEDATVEQLKNVMPNKKVLDKIKSAVNYEGSQMQKAIEEYEASRNQGETKDKEEDDAKVEEAQEAKKPAKVKAQKAKPEEVVEEEDGDDSPF